ncbi:MAG: metallopeptidase family protein, partial [Caldilineaceae bacterium]|nr:metallopeptidase family protein [Caldilineaceae bacterium]
MELEMKQNRSLEEFEDLVVDAIESLPDELLDYLENVALVVEDWPDRDALDSVGVRSRADLLGLYHGIPQTERTQSYSLVMPDKISIYRRPIEMRCTTDEEVRAAVKRTVLHEIAHHFG